jgi:hypothetical protein
MWHRIRRVGTTSSLLLALLAVPPITGSVFADEQGTGTHGTTGGADTKAGQTDERRKQRDANLQKRHDELNKRRAEREEKRKQRREDTQKAHEQPGVGSGS